MVTDSPVVEIEQSSELVQSPSVTPVINDDASIRQALAAHLGRDVNELAIVISQNTGMHARGGVENGYFLAAKVNDQWQVVASGQGVIDCQIIVQYGFPADMVPECPGSAITPQDEILFKPGGTFSYIQKTIRAGEQHTFSVNAFAGQTMIAGISSDDLNVYVGISGIQGGQQLVANSSRQVTWTGKLPQTQTYLITVTTDAPETVYFLSVEIPAIVLFDTGKTSTTVNGHIEIFEDTPTQSVDDHVTYLVHASAGQTMDVKLFSADIDALSLGVYGQEDGQPYQRYQVKNSGYYGVLPSTQGYYLKVFSHKQTADFVLEITIN